MEDMHGSGRPERPQVALADKISRRWYYVHPLKFPIISHVVLEEHKSIPQRSRIQNLNRDSYRQQTKYCISELRYV